MTYYQETQWREDSYGLVRERFVVSDTIEGLYLPNAEAARANIFTVTNISRKTSNGVGGIITSEINVDILEPTFETEADYAALNFVKEARTVLNKRYVAFFINPDATPAPNQALFVGLIQTEIEKEELTWTEGTHFSTTTGALSKWKFKATPFNQSALESFTLADLINGNPSKNVTGISEAWETANVQDRQGFFHWTLKNRDVVVESLVSLNALIDVLLGNLSASLAANGFGDISFNLIGCQLDPTFYPARWRHWVVRTRDGAWHNGRYVKAEKIFDSNGKFIGYDFIDVYAEDGVRLSIGKPNETPETSSVWWSYRNVKAFDDEPEPNSAKSYRIDKEKNLIDFLVKIAEQFGLFLKIYFATASVVNIEFIPYRSFGREQAFPRTATKFSTRMTSAADAENQNNYYGDALYLATEGQDAYLIYKQPGFSSWTRMEGTGKYRRGSVNGNPLYFTISPTVKVIDDMGAQSPCWDDGYSWYYGNIPHNHVFADAGEKKTNEQRTAHGLHTAIYLKVAKNASHPDSDKEPDYYWTPAAMLSVKSYERKSAQYSVKEYNTMTEYLQSLYNRNKEYISIESEAEYPFFCSFGEDELGSGLSWQRLDVGTEIVKDSLHYVVIESSWDTGNKTIKVKLTSSDKYNFDIPDEFQGVRSCYSDSQQTVTNEDYPIAHNFIPRGSAYAINDEGKAVFATPNEVYYGNTFFIALQDAEPDERVKTAPSSIVGIPEDWADLLPGKPVYLNMPEAAPPYSTNISQTPVPTNHTGRNLFVQIGVATDARHFKITQDSPRRIYPSEAL